MSIRETILKQFSETLAITGGALQGTLDDDTVLLDSGLDSLGFAILVSRLEETFDCDPFTLMEEPVYPHTFGEFVGIYERYVSE